MRSTAVFDADSHLMEVDEWLPAYADPRCAIDCACSASKRRAPVPPSSWRHCRQVPRDGGRPAHWTPRCAPACLTTGASAD
jgi:hypothetical protein